MRSRASKSSTCSTKTRGSEVSCGSNTSRRPIPQHLVKVPCQQIDIDVLDRHAQAVIPILARPPLRRAHRLPVRRPIHRAAKPVALHEGFDQRDRVAVFGLPIGPEPPPHPPQNPTAQARHAYPRQQQKSSIGVLIQPPLYVGLKAIKARPPIDRLQGDEAAGRRGEAQHDGPRSNPARSCTESAARQRRVSPPAPSTSIAHRFAGAEATPANRTSRNTTGGAGARQLALRLTISPGWRHPDRGVGQRPHR